MNKDRGNGTNLWIEVQSAVLVEVLVLVQALAMSRAVVASSEHAEEESRGASFGAAAHETVFILPKAAFRAATTASPSLQIVLAGRLVFGESKRLDRLGGCLCYNVSVCRRFRPHESPSGFDVPDSREC